MGTPVRWEKYIESKAGVSQWEDPAAFNAAMIAARGGITDGWSTDVVTREIIGHVGVDSGTVMLIDPCYVLKDSTTDQDYDAAFEGYFDESNGYQMVDSDTGKNLWRPHTEWNDGVIVSTLMGDGGYPVIAEKNAAGSVVRVIIDFGYTDPLCEDEDDDECDVDWNEFDAWLNAQETE